MIHLIVYKSYLKNNHNNHYNTTTKITTVSQTVSLLQYLVKDCYTIIKANQKLLWLFSKVHLKILSKCKFNNYILLLPMFKKFQRRKKKKVHLNQGFPFCYQTKKLLLLKVSYSFSRYLRKFFTSLTF